MYPQKSISLWRIRLCALFTFIVSLAFAQDSVNAVDDSTGTQSSGVLPSLIPSATTNGNDSVARILSVRVLRGDLNQDREPKFLPAYANDIISIKISNVKQFFLLRPTDFSKLLLYANGIQLQGIESDRLGLLSKQDVLSGRVVLPDTLEIPFQLLRDSTTQDAWKNLYNLAEHWYSHQLTFNADLGWEGMFPLSYSSAKQNLTHTEVTVIFYEKAEYWTWVIFYIVLIGLFIFLCAKTNLIRAGNDGPGVYSLAQTQLVFWTVLVIGGFIYSLVLTDLTSALKPSVLLMLGVSIGTSGLATGINYYKEGKGLSSIKKHKNFLFDILSDGQTISVHRTQILLWNVVFGIYLVFYTISNKTMPDFSTTMLALSGISSSFYLGSKFMENGTLDTTEGAADTGVQASSSYSDSSVMGNNQSVPVNSQALAGSGVTDPALVNNPVTASDVQPVSSIPPADTNSGTQSTPDTPTT